MVTYFGGTVKPMPYEPSKHGPRRVVGPGFHELVYGTVQQVPPGRVTTYGDVAGKLGLRTVARHVGYALAAIPEDLDVPWHRVVNGRGRLSPRDEGDGFSQEQRRRLEAEGVEVNPDGRVADFAALRWLWM
ncbi:MAG: methyltransferase [Planctomycetes bacterium]|nr:methyltransferase [Planctomycetota bacterium]